MSVGRTSGNSNTFWQFPRVGATQVLLYFRISHDVYFVILKKKILLEIQHMSHMNFDTEWGGKVTISSISSQNMSYRKLKLYMYREVFNFQWNLLFDISDYEMWKSCFKWVLSVLQVMKNRLTWLFIHVNVREVREKNNVFTFP
jgi:hypothetical protein